MPPKDLEQYVDWVLGQKPELEQTDPAVKEQLKKDLVSRLEDQINVAILAALPPGEVNTFEQMLARSGKDELQKFCQDRIPNLEEVVAGVLVKFKISYLGA